MTVEAGGSVLIALDDAHGKRMIQVAGEEAESVSTPAGIDIPTSAMKTHRQLVAILREACSDLPMEAEPGDFLLALDRNADGGDGR